MSDESRASYCFECKQPLTEIDNRGRSAAGCMNCNIWWSLSCAKVPLSEEDLRAIHQLRRGQRAPTKPMPSALIKYIVASNVLAF
jgi:hypothetical protein